MQATVNSERPTETDVITLSRDDPNTGVVGFIGRSIAVKVVCEMHQGASSDANRLSVARMQNTNGETS